MDGLPPQLTGQSDQMMGANNMVPDMEQEPEKILAYFSLDELEDLDQALLQLLQSIYKKQLPEDILFDPETGLRNYTPLDQILRDPEIDAIFTQALSQQNNQFAEGGEVERGRPIDPELENLRLEGRGGDKELAIITPFLLDKFAEWGGREPKMNPNGIPEFGGFGNFFRTLVRIAAPVVGAFLGGPAGAALASGLATKLTGGSWGQSIGAAAIGGLGAFAAPAIGGMFQGAFPGVSGALGQAARGIFGQSVGGGLANLFTPSAGAAGIVSPMARVGMGSVGQMIPGAASAAGQGAMQAAGQTGGGGFLSSLLPSALPLIGSGLLLAKGHKEEEKGLKEYQRALAEQEKRQRGESESMRESFGFNAKLNPLEPYRRRQVQPSLSQEQYMRGIQPHYFENYAQGGAIRGMGKGQQDNIPTNLKEGSYIIDASTVSDIGDGSSDAGMRELDQYFSKASSPKPLHRAGGGIIKAMVSDGEYEISPERVTAIGGGSNQKGAKILKKFVKEVRAKKRTSGSKLPPKSKPIGGYLRNIHHSFA